MKYVAAFLMAKLAKDAPTAEDVKNILSSVDCQVDDERLKDFMAEVEGKDINALIAAGGQKLASFGGGGGGGGAAAPAAAAAGGGAAAAPAKAEAKAESEEDDDMGFGLFD
eukprot:TRINITY_DN19332_c0_g2_i1.p2 TRINITY_DN19332_c0_g2~~TRINITY_DN19332_c0_g2_i1.p2  ORF type:complete len:111 (+),score=48.88 TRINITY_DN19332_c0_g2_i1:49-381(+)